jgi:hypothetical protein
MRTLLLASAAMLLSGSFALADNPLIPNDNDHMSALGFAIERNAAVWSGRTDIEVVTAPYRGGGVGMSSATLSRVTPGFLLSEDANDHKLVENQYAS